MSHSTQTESSSQHVPEMSHYEVLGVATDATLEEIRKTYQSLALRFHPDKMQSLNDTHGSDRFIRVDEAWKVLRDTDSRRVYDAELMQRTCREEYFVNEVLTRNDFEHEQQEDYYYHTCRCGGFYVLPDTLSNDERCYISCDECSLVVEVNSNKSKEKY